MSSTNYVIKRGDTWPRLVIVCTGDGTPLDLSGAQSITVYGRLYGRPLFSKSVTGDTVGEVVVPLELADTARTGEVRVEVEVTWGPGEVQTFPGDAYLTLNIVEDLG